MSSKLRNLFDLPDRVNPGDSALAVVRHAGTLIV